MYYTSGETDFLNQIHRALPSLSPLSREEKNEREINSPYVVEVGASSCEDAVPLSLEHDGGPG